ncbi:hypothetical protein ACFVYR_34450 [Streptomyces sp. NPDC058284]|uniref:hypothetical protein n=1 Tax=unclassified Streptomyces TaxID=2593676 RepID=UPI00365481D8
MKLRRAVAAAAATAAIAPAALLSAPTAFATEGTVPAPPAVTADTAKTPEAPETPTGTPTPPATVPSPGAPTPSKSTPGPVSQHEEPTKAGKTPEIPKGADAPEDPADEPDEPLPADCPTNRDGVDANSVLEVDLVGLPKKLVPGSGWHRFELTAANPTDDPLGEVRWTAFVNNFPGSKDKKDALRTYADLQFRDPETDEWTTIDSKLNDGLAYGTTELDAEDEATIELRVRIGAKAPLGKGYAFGRAKYVDAVDDCVHSSDKYHPLTIAKAGGDHESPATPTATPTPSPSRTPAAVKKQQGGAQDTPVADGSLAETGAGSMLPTVGLVGGVAVVAGAGVMFAVRRRKTDSAV